MEWLDAVTQFCQKYHVVAFGIAGILLAGAISAIFYKPWGDFIVRRKAPKLTLQGKRINLITEKVCRVCLKVWRVDEMYAEGGGRYICGVCREAERMAAEELRRRTGSRAGQCRRCQQTKPLTEMYVLPDKTLICRGCRDEVLAKRKGEQV